MTRRMPLLFLGFCAALAAGLCRPTALAQDVPANHPPAISHEPVVVAARGQSISIRAAVTDEDGTVKSVSLFYSTSKDSAPFRLAMQDTGAGLFFRSIAPNLVAGLTQLAYYIEATDDQGAVSETPWHTIRIQGSQVAADAAGMAGGPAAPKDGGSWKKTALIAGGTALLVGGGVALAASGGDSGGGSSGGSGSSTNFVGAYFGSATTCLSMAGASATCKTEGISITVAPGGVVSSDTLYPGQNLSGRMNGADFTLTASIGETNRTGEIRFRGTALTGRLTGSIEGSVVTTSGDQGTYSGTFNATRQ
jgi:hypothetical protein